MDEKNPALDLNNKLIVCRCENVSLGHLLQAIQHSRATTVNALKKLTRAGMGPCQGRTCARTIEKILQQETGSPLGTETYRSRPPVRNIALATLAAAAEQYRSPEAPVSVVMLRISDTDETSRDPDDMESG